ncbi:MAG: hypothetical protein ACQEWL_18680 [Pseudomonadota bacterium]
MSKSLVFKGNEITPFDNGDGKIWFTSPQMAKLLEYKNEKSVTNLYNANKDEFSDDMTMGPSPVPTFYDAETLEELRSVGYIEPK